jgi:chromosome segregation ATPase
LDTQLIFEELKGSLGDAAARSLTRTFAAVYEELRNGVTREDFRSLRESMDESASRLDRSLTRLAEAQTHSDAKMTELAEVQARSDVKFAELADGQKRLFDAQARTEVKVTELADAQARTEVKLTELADAQARTEVKLTELADAQARTEVKLTELADAQARTEANVSRLDAAMIRLADAQARTEVKLSEFQAHTDVKFAEVAAAQAHADENISRLDKAMARLADAQTEMTTALQRLTIRTDSVVGRTLEVQFRDRIASYLGLFMRRCRLVDTAKLVDALESHLDRRELADVIRADAIASGVIDGRPSHVVVEVSAAADVDDIQRACRRAGLLRRAGLDAVPIIACEVISPESRAYAKQNEVLVWLDGRMLESGEAA